MSVLDRINRKIENMTTMLARFGIEPADHVRNGLDRWFTSSLRACQACRNDGICRTWLDVAPEHIDRIPEFCPNATRFEQIRAMTGKRTLN